MFRKQEISHQTQVIVNQDKNYFLLLEFTRDLIYIIVLLRQKDLKFNSDKLDIFFIKEIDNLNTRLKSANFNVEDINKITYLICAAIDEAVHISQGLNAPLKYRNLISYYFKEEFSGENFFKIFDQLLANAPTNFCLLKLCYLLLSLGFQGKFALSENGRDKLEYIREKLGILITQTSFLEHKNNNKRSNKKFFKNKFLKLLKPRAFFLIIFIILVIYTYFLALLSFEKKQLYHMITKFYL